jgi:hypothetical protein
MPTTDGNCGVEPDGQPPRLRAPAIPRSCGSWCCAGMAPGAVVPGVVRPGFADRGWNSTGWPRVHGPVGALVSPGPNHCHHGIPSGWSHDALFAVRRPAHRPPARPREHTLPGALSCPACPCHSPTGWFCRRFGDSGGPAVGGGPPLSVWFGLWDGHGGPGGAGVGGFEESLGVGEDRAAVVVDDVAGGGGYVGQVAQVQAAVGVDRLAPGFAAVG